MKYKPEPTDELTLEWVFRQLQYISDEQLHEHDVLHVAPTKVKVGMVVYADGTDWNPGSGEGLYVYKSGGWAAL